MLCPSLTQVNSAYIKTQTLWVNLRFLYHNQQSMKKGDLPFLQNVRWMHCSIKKGGKEREIDEAFR